GTGSPNEPRKSRCTSCPATPPNSTPSKSSTPTSKPTSPQGQALEPRQNWRTAHAPTCAAARTNPTVSKPSSAKHPCSTPQTDTPQLPYGSIDRQADRADVLVWGYSSRTGFCRWWGVNPGGIR